MSDLIRRLEEIRDGLQSEYQNSDAFWVGEAMETLEAQQVEIARLRGLLGKVFRELDRDQSPGHHHSIAGVWDDFNGDLSGKPCEWCAIWSDVRAALEQKP